MAADLFPEHNLYRRNRARDLRERAIAGVLLAAALGGGFTTLGIIVALADDTFRFFNQVSIVEYLTSTEWTPLFSVQHFGVWPLVTATVLTSAIALVIAVPLGLISAVYLSEFAPSRAR